MTISEVIEEVLVGITPAFETHLFRLNKRGCEFSRGNENITQIVDLYFDKMDEGVSIEPRIRIRVKPIEDIYRSISSIDERPFRTLGNHLFEILRYTEEGEETGKKNIYDWAIYNDQDIEKIIEIIPEYLEETILPYFEENSSVSRVDYLLNKYPRELSVHNYLYPLRANIAIIAASLNRNPRYSELVEIYEEELAEAAKEYKEEFYKLKDLLGSKSGV